MAGKRLFVAIDLPESIRRLLVDLDAGMVHVESFHLYSSKLTPAGPIHTRELTISAR